MSARERHAEGISRIALTFFFLTLLILAAAGGLAWCLIQFLGRAGHGSHLRFPPAFAVSTALLGLGSFALHRALRAVQRERQRVFRGWLELALLSGGLFMAFQSYGLWSILPAERSPAAASLGVSAPVWMLVALHGLHFFVAVLFVCFVLARALADRYDHEYYWGVSVCAWFWHVLGIAWLAILVVFSLVL